MVRLERKMNRRVFFAAVIVLLPATLGGCASGGGGSSTDRDLLTMEDLAPYRAQDVYQAVQRLRSTWLNARGSQGTWQPAVEPDALPTRADDGGAGQVQVYIDGTRAMTGLDALRDLSVEEVQEIRHMNSRDATMMYGTDHGAGAILVTTKY
jgi:hypothetical protein